MSIDPGEFRHVLGHFATGVTVITTRHEDQLHGTTVSSFCSLSLNPPLVLICLDHQSTIHDLVLASGSFGVNILAEHGETTSRHFARRALDKFAEVRYGLGQLHVPLLEDALATLECRVVNCYPGGDHSIVIGEVVSVQAQAHASPLLFFRSKYNRLHCESSVPLSHTPAAPTQVKRPPALSALANGTILE